MSQQLKCRFHKRTEFKVYGWIRQVIDHQIVVPKVIKNLVSIYCRQYDAFMTDERYSAKMNKYKTQITTIDYCPIWGHFKFEKLNDTTIEWTFKIVKMRLGCHMKIGVYYFSEDHKHGGCCSIYNNGNALKEMYVHEISSECFKKFQNIKWTSNDKLKMKCDQYGLSVKINNACYNVIWKLPDFKHYQLYCFLPSQSIVEMIDFWIVNNK